MSEQAIMEAGLGIGWVQTAHQDWRTSKREFVVDIWRNDDAALAGGSLVFQRTATEDEEGSHVGLTASLRKSDTEALRFDSLEDLGQTIRALVVLERRWAAEAALALEVPGE